MPTRVNPRNPSESFFFFSFYCQAFRGHYALGRLVQTVPKLKRPIPPSAPVINVNQDLSPVFSSSSSPALVSYISMP